MKFAFPLSLLWALPLCAQVLPEVKIAPFADVPPVIQGANGPTKPMEKTAPELKDCTNAKALYKKLGIELTAEQEAWLAKNRFLLIPVEATLLGEKPPADDDDAQWAYTSDEMLSSFSALAYSVITERTPDECKLVTPDLVLHAWHRSFQRTLEYSEQRTLHSKLETFLSSMLENLRSQRSKAKPENADLIAMNEARLAAAWVVLGKAHKIESDEFSDENAKNKTTGSPAELYAADIAKRLDTASATLPKSLAAALREEVALILAHEGIKPSPLFTSLHPDKPQDYTQFKTRSHYTKNNVLGGYFRAMMYLGRNGFPLDSDQGLHDSLILARALATKTSKGVLPLDSWKSLMEITGFFAGESDDITYPQLQQWIKAKAPEFSLSADVVAKKEFRESLMARIKELPAPRINSAVNMNQDVATPPTDPEFRLFGQRFTWDTQIMQWFANGAPEAMPSLPTAAYVAAAFGDPFGEKISADYLSQAGPKAAAYTAEFQKRLPNVRKALSEVADREWFLSLGSKQLHVMGTLAGARDANFPHYMQGDAFAAKNLGSLLGSYTQLKHDTVLYAKQLYAEGGEGGDEDGKLPVAPKGFVQPDLRFWREMERLAQFAAMGFAKHKLTPEADEEFSRYQQFAREVKFLRQLAEKEISGATITDKEWETLRKLDLNYMASPVLPQDIPNPGDGKNALVTDIATDVAGSKILMQALGRPYVMLAVVGGANGTRLTAGLAYNHLEFSRSLDEGRMTDEEWQKDFYSTSPKQLTKPAWHPMISMPKIVESEDE